MRGPWLRCHHEWMPLSQSEAVEVQRRHEDHLMSLPGVVGVGVVLADGGDLVLKVSVDPDAEVPAELADLSDIEGLPVSVERERFELQ